MSEAGAPRRAGVHGQRRRATGRLLFALLLAAAAAHPVHAAVEAPATLTPAEQRLLADTNLFAAAPQQFRARVAIGSPPSPARTPFEVWRGGRDLLLVRPLAASQRGKFFLQTGSERWFISPGARQPVRLSPTFRLAGGVSFEELLGIDLERGYVATRVESRGEVVTFHLVATPPTAAASGYAAARWVVDARRRLPLRADLLLGDGRVARVVEFTEFGPDRPLVPVRVALRDPLRGAPPLVVEVLELERREVPPALFDPHDRRERDRLLGAP